MTKSAKHWCFTVNNPKQTLNGCTNEYCRGFIEEDHKYLCQGIETGEKGTRHIQGYVCFHKRRTLASVKKWLPTAHWEACKGSPAQNRDYCLKDGSYCEHGEVPKNQGNRTDLDELHETIKNGATIEEIVSNHFGSFLRYQRGIDRVRELYVQHRDWPMSVYVYWGETGTGKTRRAVEEHPGAYFKDGSDWWDGYESHETVIWDEFYGGACKLSFFLRLTDRYPLRVPVKGGFRVFRSRTIIFTSNTDPRDWYTFPNEALRSAFERRITGIVHFSKFP